MRLQEEVAAIISQHPSILSWNVSELINRMTVVCQVLRLPPALRASLLSGHNNALLQNHTDIPQRVEYLKSFLGLPGGCGRNAGILQVPAASCSMHGAWFWCAGVVAV